MPASQNRQGTTLVELMVACVLLAVIALAGGSYLWHARAQSLTQRTQRMALECANSRLENLRRSPYDEIHPQTQDYDVHYLERQGEFWVHSDTDPGETVAINGLTLPMTTAVQYMDADGAPSSYDFIHVAVRVGYRVGHSETISLETYFSP